MERKTKVMEGVNLSGEKRKYTFKIMDAQTGLIVFHEYLSACLFAAPLLAKAVPMVVNFQEKLLKAAEQGDVEVTLGMSDLGPEALELLRYFPEVVTPNRLNMLCKQMLAGAQVEINGEIELIGETGVGEYTAGDPLEVYVTLFYAIQANYPKVIAPLSQAVSSLGLIPDSDTLSTKTEEKEEDPQ